MAWTVVPVLVLAAIAGFVWAGRLRGARAALCLGFAWLSVSLALLAKGPIALAWTALGAFFLRPRDRRPNWGWHVPGLLLACLPLGAWALLVWERLPDAYSLWRYEVLGRVTGEMPELRSRWFYFPALLGAVAPLLLPFLAALVRGLRGREPFALWFLAGLVFLLLLSSRKAAYLLPLMAPAALLTARYLERAHEFAEGTWLIRLQLLINLLLTAALLGAALAWRDHLSWGAGAMAALLCLAAGVQLRQLLLGRIRAAALAAGGALIVAFLNAALLPHLPKERTLHNFAVYLKEHVAQSTALYRQDVDDPRLWFLIDRLPPVIDDARLCATPGPAWTIRRTPLPPQAAACGWREALAASSGRDRPLLLFRRN